jgi:hypothetical protein
MKSRKIAALAVVITAALAATAGHAALSAAPDPTQMALGAEDIPNSKAKGKRLKPDAGYLSSYEREFELSKPYGSSRLLYINSEVALAAAARTPKADMTGLRGFLRTSQGRNALANGIGAELGTAVTKKDVTIGKLRTPPIGDEAVLVSLTVRTKAGRFHAAISWFRVDRALSFLVVVGLRPAGAVAVGKLGAIIVARMGRQFTPVSTAPPAVTGTPQQGQMLTASPGTFNTAAAFTYAWQRCDPAGAACADIVGATAPTYVVPTEDVGATIRVVVSATNRFGTASSQSPQTAVVT